MRIAKYTTGRSRKGFTLVELLVAAALSILIMFVIATAFQSGLQTLSTLKSLGDMAERLKTAETLLRTDLEAEHFATGATEDSPAVMQLSDLKFNQLSIGGIEARPPTRGYFRIENDRVGNALPPIWEGQDPDLLASTRATNHSFSMTVHRKSRSPEQLFSAELLAADAVLVRPSFNVSDVVTSSNAIVTDWAQVDWFLDTNRPAVLNGVTTYPLVRRVRLLTGRDLSAPITVSADASEQLSCNAAFQVNTLTSVTNPVNRAASQSIPNTSATRYGDDIVITNVLSFEVKPTWQGPTAALSPQATEMMIDPLVSPTALQAHANTDYPFGMLPAVTENTHPAIIGRRIFDSYGSFGTWNMPNTLTSVPLRIRVIAVQIKIRVYDSKNKMSRQTTMVVKL